HLHRLEEPVARNVDDAAMQRIFRRKRDRVQQKIELAPFLLDVLEYLLDLAFDGDVERQKYRRFQVFCQRLDVLPRLLVQISDGKLGSQRPKRLGAAPGDRLVVGDTDDQALASLERDLGFREYGNGHDALSLAWFDGRLLRSSANVCCAIISS